MKTLPVGQPLPEFEAVDQNGIVHRSRDYRGRWLLVYFYPYDETPICTAEARAFQTSHPAFRLRDAVVLGVSGQTAESHARFAEKCSLDFPLLDDAAQELQIAFGVRSLLGRTKRVSFLVDPDGRIVDQYRNELSGPSHARWALKAIDRLRSPR